MYKQRTVNLISDARCGNDIIRYSWKLQKKLWIIRDARWTSLVFILKSRGFAFKSVTRKPGACRNLKTHRRAVAERERGLSPYSLRKSEYNDGDKSNGAPHFNLYVGAPGYIRVGTFLAVCD